MIDFVLVNSLAFGICDKMEIDEQQEQFDLRDHNLIEITLKLNYIHPNYDRRGKWEEKIYYKLDEESVQVMAYADDITITSTHTSTSAAKKYIQPYIHKVFAWTKQNNLLLNPDKTTCTLFTPDPAEYTSNLDLTINNKALPMATHPKVLGLTLDPKLTYSTHIHNISVQAHKPLQIIKALTATGWGKQKETLMATYKAVMRPALEYASSVWSPIASSTSINKL